MGVVLYKSTDASAPSLSGTVGSLISVLDACLVNGYGSQPAAGWTKAFTGTNRASYKQGTGSNGYYLDVNDAAPSVANEAQMIGYETMTAVGTGTQPFPTSAQSSFGNVCRKSAVASSTTRVWYLLADATCFYLFVETTDYTGSAAAYAFGDIFAYKSGDIYATVNIGRNQQNSTTYLPETLQLLIVPQASWLTLTNSAHYIDRHWNGVGGAQPFGKHSAAAAYNAGGTIGVTGQVTYPNGPDGALEMAPVYVHHGGSIRGYMKGLWCPLHALPLGHGDTFSGSGNLAGKSFVVLNILNAQGQIFLETSNTWS